MAKFILEGEDGDGLPKWLTFPCQVAAGDPEDRCRISINGQRNGMGATWACTPGDKAGPVEFPTVTPSIHCVGCCHFHIANGRFVYTHDHKGRRDGNDEKKTPAG